jgi:type I restriction enzyme S subunit
VSVLGDYADFEMGQAPPGNLCNTVGDGTVFVKAGEFGSAYPIQREWTTKPLKYGRDGDVFICVVGATAGKLNLGINCAIGRSVAAIRPSDALDTKFLYYQLQPWVLKLRAASAGSAQGVISKKQLADIPLWVPQSTEQQRIVAEIEKQFSRLDEAVTNLQRVKANFKRYKASVLKAAVEGRLVETEASIARREGCMYEAGAQLLQRILAARRGSWKGKYDAPTGPCCPAGVDLPMGWTWVTVSQAMRERIVNGLSIKESATPTPVKALRLSAMSDEGLNFDDFRYLPIEPNKVNDIVIRESDFFVSRGNGSLELVGRGSVASKPGHAVIFPDTMMRLRFTEVASVGPWFQALWATRMVRRQIEERVKTTAGIYKMAQPELASITIPLPPLAEQQRIVAEVDRRLSIIREVETEVDADLKRARALRSAVLSSSFTCGAACE